MRYNNISKQVGQKLPKSPQTAPISLSLYTESVFNCGLNSLHFLFQTGEHN